MSFNKAERKQAKLKLAVMGVSGSGKTYSSLLIARGIVGDKGRIALLDTENKSASLYSSLTDFDVMDMEAPFTIDKYTKAINEAVEAKYDIIVIDSLSHAWKQILAEKEQMDQRGGNSFTNWGKITPKHEAFLSAITQSHIHLIGTMRSKTEYIVEQNDKGKQAPKKVGLAPVQRDGVEYEFTIVFDIAGNHACEASKDRTSLFDGKIFIPTLETGKEISKWLSGGIEVKELDINIIEVGAKAGQTWDKLTQDEIQKALGYYKDRCAKSLGDSVRNYKIIDILNSLIKKEANNGQDSI